MDIGLIFDGIIYIVNQALGVIFFFLPDDPFIDFINSMQLSDVMGYINWFIPFSEVLVIGTAWGVSIGVFYIYQIILRWIKAVQ